MEKQKKISLKRDLDIIFASALEKDVFPGAVLGLTLIDKSHLTYQYYCSYGKTGVHPEAEYVTQDTYFDLASLTKPFVTVLSVLRLIEERKLNFDHNLGDLLPDYDVPEDKRKITLEQLMSHCSGLPAHNCYYTRLLQIEPGSRKDALLTYILNEPVSGTGTVYVYSDLGYMLLGNIIEMQTRQSLHVFFREKILTPLGLNDHFIFPQIEKKEGIQFAATEICPWSHHLLSGRVHDDNCRVLGGVAGHAGLFGTIEGVVKLSGYLLELYHGKAEYGGISSSLFKKAAEKRPGTTWSTGFDTPSKLYSSSGKYFGSNSIGHLGFTGTSIWCDLERGICIALLTNRVSPSRVNEKIKRFRPKLHDTVMEKLANV